MGHLLSKLVAGGLSAAVILLWWPLVFPSDTVESWLIRGVIWTASFELMLHAFMPVEESLWRSRAARRVRDKAAQAGGRIAADSPEHETRLRTALACVALMVPLTLLATAPAHPLDPKPAEQVREVTKVQKIVRVETKRVKVPQRMASAAAVPSNSGVVQATPARATAPAARPVARRAPARSTTPKPAPRADEPKTGNESGAAAPEQPAASGPTADGQ